MSLHKQCITIMKGVINTKLLVKINTTTFERVKALTGPD